MGALIYINKTGGALASSWRCRVTAGIHRCVSVLSWMHCPYKVSNGVCQMCEFIIRRRLDMAKPQLVRTVDVNTIQE